MIQLSRIILSMLGACLLLVSGPSGAHAAASGAIPGSRVTFPLGAATPSEVCGACHTAIYREFAMGFGSDMADRHFPAPGKTPVPGNVSSRGTGHALAGKTPPPSKQHEADGEECASCHFPDSLEIPRSLQISEMHRPTPRKGGEELGLTCVGCHLTRDGSIRGPYNIAAPHDVRPDGDIKTSLMCAFCHSLGKREVGRQTQTFLEWRDDFFLRGLGRQNCQDCHMPHTVRRLTADASLPERVSSRHLWTGGRSVQRLLNALSQVIVQPAEGKGLFRFHVINIGAGHSVPTGSHRRAVYLQVEAVNGKGKSVASRQWMFAPWYGSQPDDPALTTTNPGASRPGSEEMAREQIIRAGEERVLEWAPRLPAGRYTVTSRLVYDLNRYNSPKDLSDQTRVGETSLKVVIR